MKNIFCLLPLLFFIACNEPSKSDGENGEATKPSDQADLVEHIGYRLSEPDEIYTLPGSLKEISGMQSINNTVVACVQDEKGIIYLFDREQRKLVQEIKWGKDGDYEGVAGNADTLYVLESNGNIHQVANYQAAGSPSVKSWETGVYNGCDAEGIYLLSNEKKLLVACKEGEGRAGTGTPSGVRSIWIFDLQKQELLSKPYRQINLETLEEELVTDGLDKLSLGLKKFFDAAGESGVLAPSGIAVHPNTHDLFVVSAKSGLLVVLTPTGQVKYLEELPRSSFLYPESITFTPEGDLLIGNEGKGGEPNILFFKYDAQQ